MKKLIIEKFPRIIHNRRELEKKLKIKIEIRGKEIYISGEPENEFIAEKIIDALNFGFPVENALHILDQEFEFHVVNIKDYTKRHDFITIRGRIIGTRGRTLRALTELTKCFFEMRDNSIGIIGYPEHIENAKNALRLIIQGSKHANVYAYLEKHQYEEPLDLGLKEDEEKERKSKKKK